ncbi:hypothetical protein [Alkanindiges illinoisensis]|uniref:hypothetical protein n=1 Tax=Alkanindiges illinoisensis TaxID=197183 RepID=UPI0012EB241B|nr:hypothetical protein [Alkanindiges illinoisensis]
MQFEDFEQTEKHMQKNKYDGISMRHISNEQIVSFEAKTRQQIAQAFMTSGISQPKTLAYLIDQFFELIQSGTSSVNRNLIDFTENSYKLPEIRSKFRQENRLRLLIEFLSSGVRNIAYLGYVVTRFDHLIATGEDSFPETPELLQLLPDHKVHPCNEHEWFCVD